MCATVLNSCKNAWEKELAKAQDLACRLEIKGDPSFHAKGKRSSDLVSRAVEKPLPTFDPMSQPVKILLLRDTSPESLSKSLPAAKAWLASSQEKLQEAKSQGENSPGIAVGAVLALRFWKAHLVQLSVFGMWKCRLKISQGSAWKMRSW